MLSRRTFGWLLTLALGLGIMHYLEWHPAARRGWVSWILLLGAVIAFGLTWSALRRMSRSRILWALVMDVAMGVLWSLYFKGFEGFSWMLILALAGLIVTWFITVSNFHRSHQAEESEDEDEDLQVVNGSQTAAA